MAWYYNDRIIRIGRKWMDDNGTKYLYTWCDTMDADAKAAAGLVWVDDPEPFDGRFYWGRNEDGTLIPKNIDDVNATDENGNPLLDQDGEQVVTKGLKTNAIATVKEQAGDLLAPTDWMVIKATEVADYSVPADVLSYRAAVRAASNTIEAVINAVTDLDGFMALYDAPVDADGNVTGNAPIIDFPKEI
jgi:hypothetical protein